MLIPDVTPIQDLLASQLAVNNSLAYELLQSQFDYSRMEALQYIFDYQVRHFWTTEIARYRLEVSDWTFEVRFHYDDADGRAYGFDHLYLFVQVPDTDWHESDYLGTIGAKHRALHLLQYEEVARQLFGRLVERLVGTQ